MSPFSAWYFIKENKVRCCTLVFMFFLGFGAYLAGLYVTNPRDNWNMLVDRYDQYVYAFPKAKTVAEQDADMEQFRRELADDQELIFIKRGAYCDQLEFYYEIQTGSRVLYVLQCRGF